MKKRFAWIALLLGSGLAHAQTPAKARPTIAVLAGLNLAKIAGDDDDGIDNRTAFVAGVGLGLPISPDWSFAPELTYSQKGAKVSEGNASATVRLNYIEIPALLRFDVPTSSEVRPFLLAGPALAFKTACSLEVKEDGVASSVSCEELVNAAGGESSFKSFDVGAMFGGGLAFNVSGRTMRVGVRYNIGLVNITDEGNSKNRVLSFVGSFEWPFGK